MNDASPDAIRGCAVWLAGTTGFLGSGFHLGRGAVVTAAHVGSHAPTLAGNADRPDGVPVKRVTCWPAAPAGDGAFYPYPDLAVLFVPDLAGLLGVPVGARDHGPADGNSVQVYGYSTHTPESGVACDSLRLVVAGPSGPFVRVVGDEVKGGFSGSMVVDALTNCVCGVLKATRDCTAPRGGWFTPIGALDDLLPAHLRPLLAEARQGCISRGTDMAVGRKAAGGPRRLSLEDAKDALVDALCAVPGMDDPDVRRDVVRRITGRLAPRILTVRERGTVRGHAGAIVDACLEFVDPSAALDALVESVQRQAPDTRALACVDEAARALIATKQGGLGPEDLQDVCEMADRIAHSRGEMFVLRLLQFSGNKFPSLLRGTNDLHEEIKRLNGASFHDMPPIVRLLVLLARHGGLEESHRTRLSRIRTEILGRLRIPVSALDAVWDEELPQSCLVLEITVKKEEDESPPSKRSVRYQVQGTVIDYREEPASPDVPRGPGQPICCSPVSAGHREAELHNGVGDTFLQEWRELSKSEFTRAEFVLPYELLELEVERWRIPDLDPPMELGHYWPVVVRSLERMEKGALHGRWRERGKRLTGSMQDHFGGSGRWLYHGDAARPCSDHGSILELTGKKREVAVWLANKPEVACLGLNFAFRDDDEVRRTAYFHAVYAGVPVIIWCRDGGDVNELSSHLTKWAGVDVRKLPDRVLRLRETTSGDGTEAYCAERVVLFWDEPSSGGGVLTSP